MSAQAVLDKRPKGWLESDVQRITNQFVTGEVTLAEGEFLTPHRIAKLIQQADNLEKVPSTGAISNVLTSWGELGFAVLNDGKPLAFIDFTDAGRSEGLEALKEKSHQAKLEERRAARAAEAEAKEAEAKKAERAKKKAEKEAAAAAQG